jgi:hypothetical protein
MLTGLRPHNMKKIFLLSCLTIFAASILTVLPPKAAKVQAVGPNDYFDALISRPDFWKGYSLRPQAGAGSTSPFYEKQLLQRNQGGFADCNSCPLYITYNPAQDTDPNRQDAAKVVIPPFSPTATTTLPANMSTTDTTIKFAVTAGTFSLFTIKNKAIKIDNEVMNITGSDSVNQIVTVSRGYLGTIPTNHGLGANIYLTTNSIGNSVWLPLATADSNTYFFSWDGYWTDSYLNSGLTNHKTYNFISKTIWFEPNTNFAGGEVAAVRPPNFNKSTDVAAYQARSYNFLGGNADWSLTNGRYLGPEATGNEPLRPQLNTFIIKPNRWVRFWVKIEQRANDYDYMDGWIADELNDPVQIWSRIPLSVVPDSSPPFSIQNFVLEYNTSTDTYVRGDMRNLVSYVKNFVALKNPGDINPLLLRPISGGVPSPLPPPPPPATTLVGDINLDGIVNSLDWSTMNSKWGTSDSSSDLNKDGIVNSIDFSLLNNNWFKSG